MGLSKHKKTKNSYVTKAKERIIVYLKKTHIASSDMIVHQLAELSNVRLDPHIVTIALKKLLDEKTIFKINKPFPNQVNIPCFFLKNSNYQEYKNRLNQIEPFLDKLKNNKNPNHNRLHKSKGNALEISVFERLFQLATNNQYKLQGTFKNYNLNDYKKIKKTEPTKLINNVKTKGKVDFILHTKNDILIIECKNIRDWIYPNNKEFLKFLQKSLDTNTIPVFIARKHHFVMNIFRLCGVITHDTQHQIYPAHEYDFASQIRDKNNIGFHDIAIHNEYEINKNNPDYISYENLNHFNSNLDNFFFKNLLPSAIKARILFDQAKPFLQLWLNNKINLTELYQEVKNNSKEKKIIKIIEDNIDLINKI